jgi:hypothetical protein
MTIMAAATSARALAVGSRDLWELKTRNGWLYVGNCHAELKTGDQESEFIKQKVTNETVNQLTNYLMNQFLSI